MVSVAFLPIANRIAGPRCTFGRGDKIASRFLGRLLMLPLLYAGCGSAPIAAETLHQAVARAVHTLPEVRTALANRRAVAESAAQARAAWFPSVDASLGHGTQHSNNPNTRAIGANSTLTRREAEITLSQLLYDAGATTGQAERFAARAEAAQAQVVGAASAVAARAAQSYVEVGRLRGLVRLAVDNVERHGQTLKQMTLLAESGKGRRADAQQADARYALARASLAQLRNQLAQEEASYRHLTGEQPPQLAGVETLAAKLPESIESALERALPMHPAVRAAQYDLLAARADRDSARSRLAAPRVALEVGTSANRDLDGIRGVNADSFAMLRLRYNLFRGGIDDSRVREAEARIDEALAALGKARNDVERELRQAWDALREERSRVPELGRYVAASNEVVASYRSQFLIGQRTLLDVLNSENELFTAKSSLFSSLSAVTAGELRVLAGMGMLLDALAIPLPGAKPGEDQ